MLIALYDADKQRKLFRYVGFSALRYAVSECSEITAIVMCLVLVLCSQLAKEVNSSNCRVLFTSSWDGLWSVDRLFGVGVWKNNSLFVFI